MVGYRMTIVIRIPPKGMEENINGTVIVAIV